jgi:hypothetical protein
MRFVLLLLVSSLSLFAQGQALDGVLEGKITSQDKSPIGGVEVKAFSNETGYERKATTDAQGNFRMVLLPPGTYNLSAEVPGFAKTTRESIILKAGLVVTSNLELVPASVSSVVTVSESIPVVEIGRTVVSNTYEEKTVRSLPTIGRSILDFFVMQPGVNARPLSTGGSGTGTPTTTYGGMGLRQLNVDGVTNQLQGGARNIVISQEAVAEFQTVTNFSAEFGRVGGGIQNAFTRSGGNATHGSGYLFTRQKFLSAKPFLLAPTAPKPEFNRYNYGGTLSGPIKKDKIFYFGSYERWQQDLPGVLTITPQNAALLRIPTSSIGAITQTFRAHTVTARVDAQLGQKNRLSGRFNYYFDRESPLGNGLVSLETLARFDEDPYGFTVQNVTLFNSSVVNELRFLYGQRGISNGVLNEQAPNINISGFGSFNGNSNGTRVTRERGFQIIDNLTWTTGRHSVKFGFDILPVWFRERTTNINGSYTFGGLGAVAGVRPAISALDQFLFTEQRTIDPSTSRPYSYSRFTQSTGQEFFEAPVINLGLFVQDDIRLTQKLKLNIGMRYELFVRPEGNLNQDLPATGVIPQDYNNFAPRIGLAFDPKGDGKTVLRTGYGIYYNTVVAQTFNTFLRSNGRALTNINVTPTDPGAPAFSRNAPPSTAGVAGVLSDVRVFDPNFRDLFVHQIFFTVERELLKDFGVAATWQGTFSRNLPYSLTDNLPTAPGTLPDGRPRYTTTGRPNPRYGNIFRSISEGYQDYNGLILTATKRFSKGLSMQFAYHGSRVEGIAFANDFTGFGIFTSPSDPRTASFDKGPGDFDMRHRITFTGVWEPRFRNLQGTASTILNGWNLSSRVIGQTGFAFNATTGRDENGDTIFNDRPSGIGYNAFKEPEYATVDFRLARNIRFRERNNIELMGEVFNVANRLNPTGINRVFGFNPTPNANFRTVTSAENTRQFQLAIRYSF